MKIVYAARPDDVSALKTLQFFEEILVEDHVVKNLDVHLLDDEYIVRFEKDSTLREEHIDKDRAEQLLADIQDNPKYNEQ